MSTLLIDSMEQCNVAVFNQVHHFKCFGPINNEEFISEDSNKALEVMNLIKKTMWKDQGYDM